MFLLSVLLRMSLTLKMGHCTALFVHFRQIHAPYVSAEERFEFKRADIPNQYRVIVRGGYNEKVINFVRS